MGEDATSWEREHGMRSGLEQGELLPFGSLREKSSSCWETQQTKPCLAASVRQLADNTDVRSSASLPGLTRCLRSDPLMRFTSKLSCSFHQQDSRKGAQRHAYPYKLSWPAPIMMQKSVKLKGRRLSHMQHGVKLKSISCTPELF